MEGSEAGEIKGAWNEREITVPARWKGRRIALEVECLNSVAAVFVDGKTTGEIRFPGGELDLTDACATGGTHLLSLLVDALPLQGVLLSYTDSASARAAKGVVERRGVCGDVYLTSMPRAAPISDVKVDPSVRRREITIRAAISGIEPETHYRLIARVVKDGSTTREIKGAEFRGADLVDGVAAITAAWLPDRLWDIDTPENKFEVETTLVDGAGKPLDAAWTQRFGFREFRIEGRDFYLNEKRIHLSAVPLDCAAVGAAWATYDAAKETLERLKAIGINYVYTHNYGCEPGSHLSFAAILKAADDVRMLVGFTQPHFSDYDWHAPDADTRNGYARPPEWYVREAENHPSVVMYPMSHNATGYNEDMNPDLIGVDKPARDDWELKNVVLAKRAEAIVRRLHPSRIVYHHASGDLGAMHDSNFNANLAPVQELSDWFQQWAADGVKPVFTCEYDAPFSWDWTMYRGWYKGEREFGSANVPWEFCLAEWNAQFLGDQAYKVSETEKANLRWEAGKYRAGSFGIVGIIHHRPAPLDWRRCSR